MDLEKMDQDSVKHFPADLQPFRYRGMNALAKSNFWAAIVGYPLAGLALLAYGVFFTPETGFRIAILAGVGYFGWTLFEYFIHRYVYHELHWLPFMGRFQYLFHGIHHARPHQRDKLIMPPLPWLLVLALFVGVFYLLLGEAAFGFVGGLVLGYHSYVMVHYAVHRPDCPTVLRNHRLHHQLHHHRHPNKAFGVTTPLWDRLFGTMPPEPIGWNAHRGRVSRNVRPANIKTGSGARTTHHNEA